QLRRCMAEEARVDLRLRAGAEFRHLLAHLIGVEHCARKRRQGAGLRHRSCQFEIHGAGHRREQDRMFDLEEVQAAAIGPHQCYLSWSSEPCLTHFETSFHSQSKNSGFVSMRALIGNMPSRRVCQPALEDIPRTWLAISNGRMINNLS